MIRTLKAEVARRKNENLILEQRYRKYLERARGFIKLYSLTASLGPGSRPSSVSNDLNIGANFVSSSSAMAMMRTQLRLLAENNSRCCATSPVQNLGQTNGNNHKEEAAI